jgi:hypothetical protein
MNCSDRTLGVKKPIPGISLSAPHSNGRRHRHYRRCAGPEREALARGGSPRKRIGSRYCGFAAAAQQAIA